MTCRYGEPVSFTINGKGFTVEQGSIPVATSLLEFLRERALLPATKAGCNVGGCGACTAMVSTPRLGAAPEADHRAVNACITPILALDGCAITTAEGLGHLDAPHPIQERFAYLHASQCGFCTPGMTMSLFSLLLRDPNPPAAAVESVFSGNLCRCTGYRPLLDAAKSFAVDIEDILDRKTATSDAENALLANGNAPPTTGPNSKLVLSTSAAKMKEIREAVPAPADSFDASKFVRFVAATHPSGIFEGSCGNTFLQPHSVAQMQEMMEQYPGATIVGGNTGFLNVLRRRTTEAGEPAVVLWTARVAELHYIGVGDTTLGIRIGAAVTFTQLIERLRADFLERATSLQSDRLAVHAVQQLVAAMEQVGSPQLRNTTTLVGHVLSRPAADLLPLVQAMRGRLTTQRRDGSTRDIDVAAGAFATGAAAPLEPGEIITHLVIPSLRQLYVGFSKASMRRDNSIGQVSIAVSFPVVFRDGDAVVGAHPFIGVAGAAHNSLQFPDAAALLAGVSIKEGYLTALRAAADAMIATFRNAVHTPVEGREGFRVAVARGLLFRLFTSAQVVCGVSPLDTSLLGLPSDARAASVSSGAQMWEESAGGIHTVTHDVRDDVARAPVGTAAPCVTGLAHCTGQAVFVDDVPTPAGCLFGALVKSTVPKGRIVKIDASRALAQPGVVGFFDRNDVPGKVESSPDKEHAFCDGVVSYIGDVIGLIVAEGSQVIADRAALLVDVDYEEPAEGSPDAPCFDIAGAIAKKSFMKYTANTVVDGDVDAAFADSALEVLSGVQMEGGQEHFYMEPHALLVLPGENRDIEIVSMTQCVTKTQNTVAATLGIPASKVKVTVKRIGGAFGGKEVRSTYTAATLAVAAVKLRRPIRWRITREEDMRITGGRHPYRGEWRVAFERSTGRIRAIDVTMYSNGGCTTSATAEVMTRALMHVTNAYKIPAVRVRGVLCLTNIVSNTAYRGFGAPQAMLIMENIVEAVAMRCGIAVERVQSSHLLQRDEVTHYGQRVLHCRLDEMWARVMQTSAYEARQAQIAAFNASSRYVKRGLAIVPTLYGINFPVRHLNQGGALVCLYTDGTASVSHQAVEMGQGINTKVALVAAQALGVPVEVIHVADCASDKVPNTPPTAASMGSDLACMAVLDACETIMARLRPVLDEHPGKPMSTIAELAWKRRICLAAEGHYKTAKGAQYDWAMQTEDNTQRGPAFSYHVFGVGCAEVVVDILTGEFRVLRADLLMDCGDSLAPAIDIGQVEGAFLQGMGWATLEELVFGDSQHPRVPRGVLHSAGPHEYKVPAAADVPVDFRLELLSGAPNPFAVHGSKAVGEPPLFLAASVFFALKRAIYAARADEGLAGYVPLDSPLTAERIRMACRDEFTAGSWSGAEEYVAAGSF